MRNGRIKEDGAAHYHIMLRVVDQRRVFADNEKEGAICVSPSSLLFYELNCEPFLPCHALRGAVGLPEDQSSLGYLSRSENECWHHRIGKLHPSTFFHEFLKRGVLLWHACSVCAIYRGLRDAVHVKGKS